MADLQLIETQDGGDVVFNGIDLVAIDGFQNMPYIDMFGGNIKANTSAIVSGEQNLDWWGNALFMEQTPELQYNSDTERLLNNIAFTSAGRLLIEQTVKTDIVNFSNFATFTVFVSIVSSDRASIEIKIQEPTNLESNEFVYIWDATQIELKE